MRWWKWLLFIAFIGAFIYQAFAPYRNLKYEEVMREREINALTHAWKLCNAYAQQNDGDYPQSFDMNFLRATVNKGLLDEQDMNRYMLGGDHVDTVGIYIVPNMNTTRHGSDALLVAIDEFSVDMAKNYIVVTVSGKAELRTAKEISQITPYGQDK